MTDQLETLGKYPENWREPWKTRFGRLSASLVADGWDPDGAAIEAERQVRAEKFKAEMARMKERLGVREEARPHWTERD